MTPEREQATRLRQALLLASLFIGFALFLKLPSLAFEHIEFDEVVYWSVAENLIEEGDYSLVGSPLLETLSPTIYDRPLFHHPPLYIWLLLPFAAGGALQAAVLVSWLGHALCILAVALLACALAERRESLQKSFAGFIWIPLLAVTVDPLLIFVSRRLWIDSLLAGLISLAVALAYLALETQRERLWIASGLVLGLAGLAKLPGLLAAVVILTLIGTATLPAREKCRAALRVAIPATLLVLPWFIFFFAEYGTLLPQWLKPDAFALQTNRFVAAAVARPWFYYLVKLPLIQPLLVVGLIACLLPGQAETARVRWVPWVWFVLFLGVATYQGMSGYGFQMRYLAPLSTSVYLLLLTSPALAASTRRGRLGTPLLLMLVTYVALGGAIYLMTERHAEFQSVFEIIGVLDLSGS